MESQRGLDASQLQLQSHLQSTQHEVPAVPASAQSRQIEKYKKRKFVVGVGRIYIAVTNGYSDVLYFRSRYMLMLLLPLYNLVWFPAFFGVPIVGFFDQRNRLKSELASVCNDQSTHETQPLLPRQQQQQQPCSVTFSNDVEDRPSRTARRTRAGKELWGILRYHVVHESFHIQNQFKDTTRRKHDNIQFTQDVNLPYDFSVLDCLIALVVYLIISIIAYSFVFENWTVIDSKFLL